MKANFVFPILVLFACSVVTFALGWETCPASCVSEYCENKCLHAVYTAGGASSAGENISTEVKRWYVNPHQLVNSPVNKTVNNKTMPANITAEWIPMARMNTARKEFALVYTKNRLYAILGMINNSNSNVSYIESIDTSYPNAPWEIHAMPNFHDPNSSCTILSIFGFATAVVDTTIYIFGGKIQFEEPCNHDAKNLVLDTIYTFNTTSKQWGHTVSRMDYGRYDAVAETVGSNVYLFGGCLDSGSNNDVNQLFNTTTNTWTNISSRTIAHPARASMMAKDNLLFFFEKHSCQNDPEREVFAHVYDTDNDTWISDPSQFPDLRVSFPIWTRPQENTLHVLEINKATIEKIHNVNILIDEYSSTVLVPPQIVPDAVWLGREIWCNGSETNELLHTVLCNVSLRENDPKSSQDFFLESNDVSEGRLFDMQNLEKIQFEVTSQNVTQFLVQGTYDDVIDGNQQYCISTPEKECLLSLTNRHITFPKINQAIGIQPKIIPLQGGSVLINGKHFHQNITVKMGTVSKNGNFEWLVVNHTRHGIELNDHLNDAKMQLNISAPNSTDLYPVNNSWSESYITIMLTNPDNGRHTISCESDQTNPWHYQFCFPGQQSIYSSRLFYTDPCAGKEGEGWYGTGQQCRPCPKGLYCPGGRRAWPIPGYWKDIVDGEASLTVYECPAPAEERCVGEFWFPCASQYAGRLCSDCNTNYYLDSHECKHCSTTDYTELVFTGITVAIFFGLVCVIIIFAKQESIDRFTFAVVGIQQIITAIRASSWSLPPIVKVPINFLKIITLDYSFGRPDCFGYGNFPYPIFYFLAIACFLAFLLFSVLCALAYQFRNRTAREEKWCLNPGKNARVDKAMICAMHLSYLELSGVTLKMLNCDWKENTPYLVVEYSQQCFKGYHLFGFIAALLMLVGLLGLPLYWGWALRNLAKQNRLNDREARAKWSFLLFGIRKEAYWYRIVSFFISFFLAFFSAFIKHTTYGHYIAGCTLFFSNVFVVIAFWPLETTRSNVMILAFGLTQSGVLMILLWVQGIYKPNQGVYLPAAIIFSFMQFALMAFAYYLHKAGPGGHPWRDLEEQEMIHMRIDKNLAVAKGKRSSSIELTFATAEDN